MKMGQRLYGVAMAPLDTANKAEAVPGVLLWCLHGAAWSCHASAPMRHMGSQVELTVRVLIHACRRLFADQPRILAHEPRSFPTSQPACLGWHVSSLCWCVGRRSGRSQTAPTCLIASSGSACTLRQRCTGGSDVVCACAAAYSPTSPAYSPTSPGRRPASPPEPCSFSEVWWCFFMLLHVLGLGAG